MVFLPSKIVITVFQLKLNHIDLPLFHPAGKKKRNVDIIPNVAVVFIAVCFAFKRYCELELEKSLATTLFREISLFCLSQPTSLFLLNLSLHFSEFVKKVGILHAT